MRNSAILFDLDDTLIDTRKRHFNIVIDFINKYGKILTFGEYLSMRKNKHWSNAQVVNHLNFLNVDEFRLFWKRNIESQEYFKHDVEIVNTALLNELKAKKPSDFILLSIRSNPGFAEQQFKQLSFYYLFDNYHFFGHSSLNPKIEKLKLYKKVYDQIIFVSDSQEDCRAAELAGVDFVGVQSGVYNIDCKEHFDDINSFLLKQIEYAD